MTQKIIRPVAIYLPQFHPIPENDAWWGRGFTEWTNVTAAKPLFQGHYQPHLPTDSGYYDLRVPEVREAQAEMARAYGIHGFCYYHYWFKGKRLLERPFEEVLHSGKPDFPFMLLWANETWSRRWLGEERDILIKQEYSAADDQKHASYLANVFTDPRYIRVNGRPVFVIYRPLDLPDARATIDRIRQAANKAGLEPLIVASNSHVAINRQHELLDMGFDLVLDFSPQLGVLPQFMDNRFSWKRFWRNGLKHGQFDGKLKLYSYVEALEAMISIEPPDFSKAMPCVFVGWDNVPRRGANGIVVYGNDPEMFEAELRRAKAKLEVTEGNHDLLFINAWNEWAEGNHLEPDKKNGPAFLESIKRLFG